jgi:hypothetical protein
LADMRNQIFALLVKKKFDTAIGKKLESLDVRSDPPNKIKRMVKIKKKFSKFNGYAKSNFSIFSKEKVR